MTSNYDIVKAHYAASDRKDLAGMLADVAPDARWTEMEGFPCAGTFVGPQAIRQNVFERLGREWDGYSSTLEALLDAGERVVGIGTYHGVFKETGKAMSARVAHVWRLADGKIRAFEQFTDTLLVANAMR
ncbi:hypothetical protein SAMN05444161_1710 [Rhizobiales bacterium GAS191]|nr:hypothetical protein SAMN05444161_1710 [Rhizobiales bacterium GAS191]